MEKPLTIIDVILVVIERLAVVFAAVIGAEGIYIAVNSFNEPGNMRQLPLVLSVFVIIVVLRVICGLIEIACSRFVEKRNNAAICIAFSVIMTAFIAIQYPVAGIISAIAYVTIGGMIPVSNAMNIEKLKSAYEDIRQEGNHFIGDVAYGVDEIIQYGRATDTISDISKMADKVSAAKEEVLDHEKSKEQLLALARSVFSVIIIFLMLFLYSHGKIRFEELIIISAAAIFSFRECSLD